MPTLNETESQHQLQKAVALYDNVAETNDELAFRNGDILTVIEQDTCGLRGWWLCSLRGRQGICPGNRLKIITLKSDVNDETDQKRQSWNIQSDEESADYDQPRSTCHYDVPPPNCQPVLIGSYDSPRPLVLSRTPSSGCLSSSAFTQSSGSFSNPAAIYDVPRGEVDQAAALLRLDMLETEVISASGKLLAAVGSNWRQHISEIKVLVSKLQPNLSELAVLGRTILQPTTQDSQIVHKLRPLIDSVSDLDSKISFVVSRLEAKGWNNIQELNGDDPLDDLITYTLPVVDEVRRMTSFIQGNAPLLFKKHENYVNANIELEQNIENDANKWSMQDRFYRQLIDIHASRIAYAVDSVLAAVEQSKPPATFLGLVKRALLCVHTLVMIADTLQRSDLADSLSAASHQLSQRTKMAAQHFPSVSNVQEMVNSLLDVVHLGRQLNLALEHPPIQKQLCSAIG